MTVSVYYLYKRLVKMNPLLIITISISAIVAFYFILCALLSRMISFPKKHTYEESVEYEKMVGNWGSYDSFKKEQFLLSSFDGYELHGLFIRAKKPSDKYVIITHGWTYLKEGTVKYINLYYSLGFNVIVYDNRGHGENKKFPCSMGYRESKDLLCLIDHIEKKYSPKILGLHGESMGSAISLIALKEKPPVNFAVLDCGYSDLKKLIKEIIRKTARAPLFLYNGMTLMSRLLYGYFIGQVRPIDSMKDNEIPLCFIHGNADDFILCEHSRCLKDACKGYSELHLIEGAGHAMSLDTSREEYYSIVKDFLSKVLQK